MTKSFAFLSIVLGVQCATRADLAVLSHSAVYDSATATVAFSIQFDGVPDFLSTGPFGQQTDSFQFYLFTLPEPGLHGVGNTILRGEEIHTFHEIPVRNDMLPSDGTQGSGGWGPIAGLAQYSLTNGLVQFSVPFSVLNTPDGVFTYRLLAAHLGAGYYNSTDNHSVPTPTSAAVLWIACSSFSLRRPRRDG